MLILQYINNTLTVKSLRVETYKYDTGGNHYIGGIYFKQTPHIFSLRTALLLHRALLFDISLLDTQRF